ncbi:hypothetical protein MSMTP_3113 [Methanosarcina sp. MTP4]|nr:hypothetical protein MSMTP_3113 [Methanosarcina sp. MTP4]
MWGRFRADADSGQMQDKDLWFLRLFELAELNSRKRHIKKHIIPETRFVKKVRVNMSRYKDVCKKVRIKELCIK